MNLCRSRQAQSLWPPHLPQRQASASGSSLYLLLCEVQGVGLAVYPGKDLLV